MTRIFVLLGLIVLAIVASFVLDGDDERKADERAISENSPLSAKKLPRLQNRKVALGEYAASGKDPAFTLEVAAATRELVIDGGLPLDRLGQIGASDRVTLDLLQLLPGFGAMDPAELGTLIGEGLEGTSKAGLAQGQLDLSALQALAAKGRLADRWLKAFERIISAPGYQSSELSLSGSQIFMRTAILEWERQGRMEPVGSLEVFDVQGRILLEWDQATAQWILPEFFGKPAMARRMRDVASWLDGLHDAEARSKAASFAKEQGTEGEAGSRVKIRDLRGEMIVDLRIGKVHAVPGQGRTERSTWVRPTDGEFVYLHPRMLSALATSNFAVWSDTRLFPIEASELSSKAQDIELLVLEYDDIQIGSPLPNQPEPTGTRMRVVLSQEEVAKESTAENPSPPDPRNLANRRWALQEPESAKNLELDTGMTDQLAFQLLNARAQAIVGNDHQNPKYGFQTPILDLSATLGDGSSFRLLVGAEVPPEDPANPAPMKTYYAHASGSPFVAALNEGTVKALQRKPESFVRPAPPTPAAPPEGETPAVGPTISPPPEEPGTKPPLPGGEGG